MRNELVVQSVRAFIRDNFLYSRPDEFLDDNASLMSAGIVDSMGVAEIIQFIEEEFALNLPDEDITEANLGSVNAIAAYIGRSASSRAVG